MTPSPAPPKARDYQIAAVAEVTAALLRGEHPIVAAPTGSGKSWIIAERILQANVENPKFRAIVVCRTKELAVQNFNTLAVLAPPIHLHFQARLRTDLTRLLLEFREGSKSREPIDRMGRRLSSSRRRNEGPR